MPVERAAMAIAAMYVRQMPPAIHLSRGKRVSGPVGSIRQVPFPEEQRDRKEKMYRVSSFQRWRGSRDAQPDTNTPRERNLSCGAERAFAQCAFFKLGEENRYQNHHGNRGSDHAAHNRSRNRLHHVGADSCLP